MAVYITGDGPRHPGVCPTSRSPKACYVPGVKAAQDTEGSKGRVAAYGLLCAFLGTPVFLSCCGGGLLSSIFWAAMAPCALRLAGGTSRWSGHSVLAVFFGQFALGVTVCGALLLGIDNPLSWCLVAAGRAVLFAPWSLAPYAAADASRKHVDLGQNAGHFALLAPKVRRALMLRRWMTVAIPGSLLALGIDRIADGFIVPMVAAMSLLGLTVWLEQVATARAYRSLAGAPTASPTGAMGWLVVAPTAAFFVLVFGMGTPPPAAECTLPPDASPLHTVLSSDAPWALPFSGAGGDPTWRVIRQGPHADQLSVEVRDGGGAGLVRFPGAVLECGVTQRAVPVEGRLRTRGLRTMSWGESADLAEVEYAVCCAHEEGHAGFRLDEEGIRQDDGTAARLGANLGLWAVALLVLAALGASGILWRVTFLLSPAMKRRCQHQEVLQAAEQGRVSEGESTSPDSVEFREWKGRLLGPLRFERGGVSFEMRLVAGRLSVVVDGAEVDLPLPEEGALFLGQRPRRASETQEHDVTLWGSVRLDRSYRGTAAVGERLVLAIGDPLAKARRIEQDAWNGAGSAGILMVVIIAVTAALVLAG